METGLRQMDGVCISVSLLSLSVSHCLCLCFSLFYQVSCKNRLIRHFPS